MKATKECLAIEEVTVGEAEQTPMVEDVLEGTGVVTKIPKSPLAPQSKQDK